MLKMRNPKQPNLSLKRLTLKRRIWIALSLITILPLLVLLYYLSYAYVPPISIFIIIVIVLLGWWIIFEIFRYIAKISLRSLGVISQFEPKGILTDLAIRNEVEGLDMSFDIMSSKVKTSLDEFKTISNKIEVLNREISQRAAILSSMVEAYTLLSKDVNLEEIFQLLVDRLHNILGYTFVLCFLKKKKEDEQLIDAFVSGIDYQRAKELLADGDFRKVFELRTTVVIDKDHQKGEGVFLKAVLGVHNLIVHPLYLKRMFIGFMLVGNYTDNFAFLRGDFEAIELFAKNISIVWEYRRLSKRIEDLEIFDPLTGLYNEKFLLQRLGEEVKRAINYQRPCGFLVLEITNYSQYRQGLSVIEAEKLLKKVVSLVQDNIRPIDILGRLRDNRIGVILIERNKRQCNEVVRILTEAFDIMIQAIEPVKPHIAFAVAESPIDGMSLSQLLESINSQLHNQ